MIVHPGSNVAPVLNYASALVGGLSFSNFPSPSTSVASLTNVVAISPTLLELNGS